MLGFISTCSGQTDDGQEKGENRLLFPAFSLNKAKYSLCKVNESFKNAIRKTFSNLATLVIFAQDEHRMNFGNTD